MSTINISHPFAFSKSVVKRVHGDSLYRNSFYLMGSTGILAGVGFFFWIIAARVYSPEEIGIGGSLISLAGLLVAIATLGFPHTLIRFLPTSKRPNQKISTSLILTGVFSFLVSIVFWFISKYWLADIHEIIASPLTWLIFSLALLIGTWQQIGSSINVAFQRTQWIMLESTIASLLKLGLAAPLVFLGGYGIFTSNYLGLGVAVTVSFGILAWKYKINFLAGFHKSILREVGRYSMGTYFSNLVGILPAQLLPALIVKQLGAESSAYFFLAQMMVNLLLIIPMANSQILFAQASKEDQSFRVIAIKSLKVQLVLVGLGIASYWLLGGFILQVFGKGYLTETLVTLRILSLMVIPSTISYTFVVRLRVLKRLKIVFWISLLSSIIILSSCILGSRFGLSGVASGYVLGQTLQSIIYVISFFKTSANAQKKVHLK